MCGYCSANLRRIIPIALILFRFCMTAGKTPWTDRLIYIKTGYCTNSIFTVYYIIRKILNYLLIIYCFYRALTARQKGGCYEYQKQCKHIKKQIFKKRLQTRSSWQRHNRQGYSCAADIWFYPVCHSFLYGGNCKKSEWHFSSLLEFKRQK